MAIRGILGLSLVLLVAACGNQGGPSTDGTQNADAPKRRIALQDLVEQNKISYATAIRCMYLADATKTASETSRNDRLRDNAKFYALQLLQDDPTRVESDVINHRLVTEIQTGQNVAMPGQAASEDQLAAGREASRAQDPINRREFESICVPLFLEAREQ